MLLFFLSLIYISFCREYTFPLDFQFGVATSSYQVEGAWNISGKGESNWDRLTHTNPEAIIDQSNGDIACDTYNKIKEDVQLLKFLGVNFYRFSISWSRILPNGKDDYVNPDGIRYYSELIDELLSSNIKPMVTMYHWDLPQVLEDEGGWANENMADYFGKYADVLFEHLGDLVKTWITFNEPVHICHYGYAGDMIAPMLNDKDAGYRCGKTILLAHAKAYRLYDGRYREEQKGKVGITQHIVWFDPMENYYTDIKAAEAALHYTFGWFVHPIFTKKGDYPPIMKAAVGHASKKAGRTSSRLAELTPDEIELISGTADFLGVNHYTTASCSAIGDEKIFPGIFYYEDADASCISDFTEESAASIWLKVIPRGFRKALNWIKDEYNNPEVIITESGYSNVGHLLADCRRVYYYNAYLEELLKAIHDDGCNVKGFTAWSFLDNFEWRSGYLERFGLFGVDFKDPTRRRTAKLSAHVYKKIISEKKIDWKYTPEGFQDCEWLHVKDEL
ncbi:hypothetical protein Trydic_g4034 [Trypoxylus dichotomus]